MQKIVLFVTIIFSFILFIQVNVLSVNKVLAQGWTQGQQAVSGSETGLPETSAKEVVLNILKWLLGLVFVLTVLAFVGSGVMFIMSFSNNTIVTMAKDWLTYAIIGLVVSVLGFVLVLAISNMLTGNLQNTRGGGGGGGGGGFWANIWGRDRNGNDVNVNTGPNGTTVDGRLGDFDFSIPVPISTPGSNNTPAQPWVNPDTGQNYDYNTGR